MVCISEHIKGRYDLFLEWRTSAALYFWKRAAAAMWYGADPKNSVNIEHLQESKLQKLEDALVIKCQKNAQQAKDLLTLY